MLAVVRNWSFFTMNVLLSKLTHYHFREVGYTCEVPSNMTLCLWWRKEVYFRHSGPNIRKLQFVYSYVIIPNLLLISNSWLDFNIFCPCVNIAAGGILTHFKTFTGLKMLFYRLRTWCIKFLRSVFNACKNVKCFKVLIS